MTVSKKNDFVSNPNLPKWPFLQKINLFANLATSLCILAKSFTLEIFRKCKIAHVKVVFRLGLVHQGQQKGIEVTMLLVYLLIHPQNKHIFLLKW